MRAHQSFLAFITIVAAAIAQGCAPDVSSGGEGSAKQAAEGDNDKGGDTPTPANDPGTGQGCGEPAPDCTGVAVGDGNTCLSNDDLTAAAQDACAEQDLIAVQIYAAYDCGADSSRYGKIVCCATGDPATGPEPPPDPGPPSASGGLGDGTCRPNSDYQQLAEDACAAAGLPLAELYTANDCSADSSGWAKYLCQ